MIVDFNKNEINKIISSLRNDSYLKNIINIEDERDERIFYMQLSYVIVNNIDVIKEFSVDELVYPNRHNIISENNIEIIKTLITDITKVFSNNGLQNLIVLGTIEISLYKRIIFSIKYFSIKNFFSDNYKKFIPSYDFMNMQQSPKTKLFMDSTMKEFDRFASIINDISYVTDIDSVPTEYINYLAQLVGYQKDVDDSLFNYITFREFIKNIIEVYKIKGTSFSIELFFGFIGFTVEISELWFDRRYYYLSENTERKVTNKNTFEYYLTKIDPRLAQIEGIHVFDSDISSTKNLYNFNKLIENEMDLETLLGLKGNFKKEKYTFFKTNVITINAVAYAEDISIDSTKQDLIQNYIKFLIPIFIQNYTNYDILEPIDIPVTETLYLYDLDRINYNNWLTNYNYSVGDIVQKDLFVYKCILAHKSNEVTNPGEEENEYKSYWTLIGKTNDFDSGEYPEYMLHSYSGYSPTRYNWNDGITSSGNQKEGKGGIYPSGFYKGTSAILDGWSFDKTYEENISDLGIKSRDVLGRFEDPYCNYKLTQKHLTKMLGAPIMLNKNFSYIKGEALRNSNAISDNITDNIQSIDASEKKITLLNKKPYRIEDFNSGDKIEVFSSALSNRGIYTIETVSSELNNIYIKVEEPMVEDQSIGGSLKPYFKEWLYEDFIHTFMGTDQITIE